MVVTCSDTRTEESDASGRAIRELLDREGHAVRLYRIVKDDPEPIRRAIEEGIAAPAVEAILINGGTGLAKRDVAFETVDGLLEKRLPGFGELFRFLSYREIGSAAILSRATAGACKGRLIVSMPGSENAVRLAMERLILPELTHIVSQIQK
ncbi:MAG: MogA/MoaB family molybdenum cofactor biosynthesis protein [Nitrospirae bacterium]|nr:MogA/MoaB family molybdenum cofactor biosynthesis protein [Nitrospirota bacterium]